MDQRGLPIYGRTRLPPAAWRRAVFSIVGLGLISTMGYLEAKDLATNIPLEQLVSYELISYANLLLIGSTILYVAHLRFRARSVGRWATGLSAIAALGLVTGLVARGAETYFMHPGGYISLTNLPEVMSLFSAITVVIYLTMERVYRTRSGGAFVMPIVAAAALFQARLVSIDQVASGVHFPILRSYWIHAHVLANFMGYGAFAVAAAMGVMHLLRRDAENHPAAQGFAIRSLPDLPRIDRWMHQSISLGFPLFSFATILGIASANEAWGRYWAWDPKETGTLIVWMVYASYFYLHYAKKWRGVRMAWCAIIGFGLAAFCSLGVNLFFSGLHSFA